MVNLYDMAGAILRAGLTRLGRTRLPRIEGQLTTSGLNAPVQIIRDHWGVPHIYAADIDDVFFAQGFVHAQERLWQMELNRRVAMGRLSELFGEVALDTDRAVRTLGFNRLGRADWQNAGADLRRVVSAYTRGINAWLRHPTFKRPLEFTLVRSQPEPWIPEEVMAFTRLMGWQLSGGWYGEIIRAKLIETVGPQAAAELEIYFPEDEPLTLPAGIEINQLHPGVLLPGLRDSALAQGIGSNAWAIAGHKSASGRPILANDPHLYMTTPSVWYEAHLTGGGLDVSGATLPGLPLVVIGHNARIAWGITLAWTDCQDLFVEQFDPQSPDRYQCGAQWMDVEVLDETIVVKGRARPHHERVVQTHHGPIISDVVGHAQQRLALSSMGLRAGSNDLRGWLLLNQAADWDDFSDALHQIGGAELNVVYADVDGNIGYRLTGKVPIRAKGNGMTPAAGWTGEYEWVGEVPFDEMPHAFNPEQGYVVSCNQRIVPDDYPHFLGNIWNNGYRARRAIEFLERKTSISFDDCRRLQSDVTCIPGREFAKRLEGLASDDPATQQALAYLSAWDGQMTTSTVGGTLYEVTRHFLFRNLLAPHLDAEMVAWLSGNAFSPVIYPLHEFWTHEAVTLLRILDNPDSWWLEQAGGRTAVLTRSVKQAVDWLGARLGPDIATWQWGRLHQARFPHAIGSIEPFDRAFNPRKRPVCGAGDTLFVTYIPLDDVENNNRMVSASYRQIVDLGDLTRSVGIHAPGQSGHLGSPHYDDLIDLWIKGAYHPLLWTREQVEQHAGATLTLSPLN